MCVQWLNDDIDTVFRILNKKHRNTILFFVCKPMQMYLSAGLSEFLLSLMQCKMKLVCIITNTDNNNRTGNDDGEIDLNMTSGKIINSSK